MGGKGGVSMIRVSLADGRSVLFGGVRVVSEMYAVSAGTDGHPLEQDSFEGRLSLDDP